jgi:TnpA family transposase
MLMPRMRNWGDATFYRPDKSVRYQDIDGLFTRDIDWSLVSTHWLDMMQVVLSIQAGLVLPSMLLPKPGSRNRKCRLYQAFRELGRVERALFLLRYIANPEIRRTIRAETTTIGWFNDFLDWISFVGPIIKSGDPVEQEKQVKYASLVANAVMLSNVADHYGQRRLAGYTAACCCPPSPYTRNHIRRFGTYELDMDDRPAPLAPEPLPLPFELPV